ncbi:hypothetical protein ACHAXH_005078 [Discostella pseudostelligera]
MIMTMKRQSILFSLIFLGNCYSDASLGAPILSDHEGTVSPQALNFVALELEREPIDRESSSSEDAWAPDVDAPSRSSNFELEYGFEREPIDHASLLKRSLPPSTIGNEFERSREYNVADVVDVEDELREVAVPTFDEPERNVNVVARRLRRLNEPAVEKRSKESYRDPAIPVFRPLTDESGELDLMPYAELAYQASQASIADDNGRTLQGSCNYGQMYAKVEIITDNSGFETSWKIRKADGELVIAGPPQGTAYDDNSLYVGGICLDADSYTFTVYDKFGDGMCGSTSGQGLYRFYLDGVEQFTSPSSCGDWSQRSHSFTVTSDSATATDPSLTTMSSFQADSRSGCYNVRIQFKVDKFGKETTVLFHQNGNMALASRNEVAAYQTKSMSACVSAGTYTLKLIDNDGICCHYGNGYYKLSVDGTPVVSGGYFVGSKSYTVKVGFDWRSNMDARDQEWLEAHNDRRRIYNGGEGYVPLRWSRSLAYDAKSYAEVLKSQCDLTIESHAKHVDSGENLASNLGTGSWGKLRTADQVMTRWVDKEVNLSYPNNAHYLQVVWRATKYVGCGESVQYQSDGQICRVQVCRYERPGSCGVRNGNWRAEAWKDDTLCGNPCPNEGCYA